MRKCELCGKGILRGNKVSHANNKTKTVWLPNIHKVHAIINGAAKRIYACASCITSGKLIKAHSGKLAF